MGKKIAPEYTRHYYIVILDIPDNAMVLKSDLLEGTRRKICHDVFSSGFFDMLEEDPVDPDEAYEMLKRRHKNILNVLRRESRISAGKKLVRTTDFRWINNIMVFDGLKYYRTYENVFTCLTRSRREGGTKVYFISDEFNVAMDPRFSYSSGYFILHPRDENNTFVEGLVENSAFVVTSFSEEVEKHYILYRKFNRIGE